MRGQYKFISLQHNTSEAGQKILSLFCLESSFYFADFLWGNICAKYRIIMYSIQSLEMYPGHVNLTILTERALTRGEDAGSLFVKGKCSGNICNGNILPPLKEQPMLTLWFLHTSVSIHYVFVIYIYV